MTARLGPLRGRRRRSWIFDAAVAWSSLVLTAPWVLDARDLSSDTLLLVAVGYSVPLLVRRIWPLPVFVSVLTLALAVCGWAPHAVLTIALLVALYTVIAQGSRRQAFCCTTALAAAAALWTTQLGPAWRSVGLVLAALIAATVMFGLYVAARRALLAELRARAGQLERERDQQAIIAAGAERARIAREMHDIVAHHLTVMVTLADGAAAQTVRSPHQATAAMRAVAATGREALTDTRRLLGVLRDDTEAASAALVPPRSLRDVDELVAGVRAAGLDVRYRIQGTPVSLDAGRQLALFRLIQESLTNTLRHAGATSVTVRIGYGRGHVSVEVGDDGKAVPGTSRGRGLIGMDERLSAIGGRVEYGPVPRGGWAVRAELPIGTAP